MACSQTQRDVLESFVGGESGVEVPLLAPLFGDAVVVLQLGVVVGLDLGVDGAVFGEGKVELDLVGNALCAFGVSDVDFGVYG